LWFPQPSDILICYKLFLEIENIAPNPLLGSKPYLSVFCPLRLKIMDFGFLYCFMPKPALSPSQGRARRRGIMKRMKTASVFFMTLAIMLPFALTTQAQPPADSCQKSCTIDADCGIGGTCNTGLCEHKTTYCLNDRWAVNERGETWNCDAYRCNSTNGLCFRQATANENCTSGYVFDGKTSCVPSVHCAANDPSCQDIYQRWLKARHDYEAQTPQPTPAPFSCVSCKSNADCDSSQMCWQGRCEKADLFCNAAGDGESAVWDRNGIVAKCATYACDPIAKACFAGCQTNQDCAKGKTCSAGQCQ
jgi:hypothetical protein